MRIHPLALIVVFATAICAADSAICAETTAPVQTYPLWDNVEPVAEYAKRVNLPPTKTLDLGNGVKLDLVLIPAGKFIMGTPEPTPVDEAAFQKSILIGQSLLALSATTLVVMLGAVIVRAIRQKRRPQVSLAFLMMLTIAAGGCVLSGLHWRQTVIAKEKATGDFAAAEARYHTAGSDEKPAHPVRITQAFYMGKFSVTQDQYQQIIGRNPSHFKNNKNNPVEGVSWEDAQACCKKLAIQTKQAVRLPTEAEWEYSCRAGSRTTYYSGDTDKDLGCAAWFYKNCNNTTHPVGQKVANAFGLYDMHGNVWQWCEDWYSENYYSKTTPENPQGPNEGTVRVLRGGSWGSTAGYCRSASRGRDAPGDRYIMGLRVVVEATAP